MLCYAHSPEDTHSVGLRNHVGNLCQCFYGEPAALTGHFKCERFQALSELSATMDPLINEFLLGKPAIEDVLGHCRKPDQISAGPRPEKHIRARNSGCRREAGLPSSRTAYLRECYIVGMAAATVTATVGIGPHSQGGFGLDVQFDVSLPGLPRTDCEALVQRAHLACPYSNATRNNVAVRLVIV